MYGLSRRAGGTDARILARAAHPLLVEVAGARPGHEQHGPGETEQYEHEKALQSHRRAKVADLSEGDDDLLGD